MRDWHGDFYAQCAAANLAVVTSCSMELVNPPAEYAALFPNGNPVTTATGFGNLNSSQCAVGASKMLAYQKAVYRNIAQMQSTAGLTPGVQYGEFLWWYFADPASSGMAYCDSETVAAAQSALGRPLYTFMTPNDDPTVNSSADALFLRNRLRDYIAALVADIRSAFPTVKCEVLWPYDVNYPTPVGGTGGQLNRFVNLPVEWQQQPSSGLDTVKVEALSFSTSLRDLDLARQAIELFPSFGWPLAALRYLVPVFGFADPWERELALVWGVGLPLANLWALDHICLFNLDVPERRMARRSWSKQSDELDRCMRVLPFSILKKMPTDEEPVAAQPAGEKTPWQRVQNARHPKRPHTLDYVQRILTDFQEIHGDRLFGDDPAIVCGMGRLDGQPVLLVGEQKGRDTKQKLYRNFGMPKPEGYRKALRAMQLAAKFGRPIITFLDTPGAYPGIDAEERGQAEAIARNLREMARIHVPVIAVCIGEGGSGGALALGVANQVFMLENAVYSVITPESCASIIYRDSGKAEQAAAALKLAAPDMLQLGLIDGIIPEPPAGAHEDYDEAARLVKEQLVLSLRELSTLTPNEAVQKRYDKFRKMGNFFVGAGA